MGCPQCQHENPRAARFCNGCGAKLGEPAVTAVETRASNGSLRWTNGARTMSRVGADVARHGAPGSDDVPYAHAGIR